DHGAYAAVRQDFQQQAVRHAAVDDVHRVHAVAGRVQRRGDLRQHAARQGAVLEQRVDGLGRQAAQQLAALVQHARGVGQHDELFGAQDFGHLAGDDVGIDVVGLAVFAIADRRDDGNELVVLQRLDHGRLDPFDIAHEADVQGFAGVFGIGHELLARLDQAAVLAGQADGLAAGFVDHHDDVLLDLPAQHPLDDFHGFGVGDAHALDEGAFLADALERAV